MRPYVRTLIILAVLTYAVVRGAAVAAAVGGTEVWRWPLGGVPLVVRGFDPPPVPWAPGHRGVDLRARPNDPVYAAGGGVVGYAGPLAGQGVVAVHHDDGLETTYEPVTAVVRSGQRVSVGDLLGRVQPGHGDCGPGYVCLHWGLREGARYLDPLQLVRPGVIRLLPLWRGGATQTAGGIIAALATEQPDATSAAGDPARPSRAGVVTAEAAGTLAGLGVAAGVTAHRRRRRAPPG